MKRSRITIVVFLVILAGLAAIVPFDRLFIRESGHGFSIGNQIVLCEYGYSRGGDRLHWAIIRTFPAASTPAQRMADPRVVRDAFVWPLIRQPDGRLVRAGTAGDVYFFDDQQLKTIRVRMNEHTDTVALEDSKTLDDLWAHLQKYRVN